MIRRHISIEIYRSLTSTKVLKAALVDQTIPPLHSLMTTTFSLTNTTVSCKSSIKSPPRLTHLQQRLNTLQSLTNMPLLPLIRDRLSIQTYQPSVPKSTRRVANLSDRRHEMLTTRLRILIVTRALEIAEIEATVIVVTVQQVAVAVIVSKELRSKIPISIYSPWRNVNLLIPNTTVAPEIERTMTTVARDPPIKIRGLEKVIDQAFLAKEDPALLPWGIRIAWLELIISCKLRRMSGLLALKINLAEVIPLEDASLADLNPSVLLERINVKRFSLNRLEVSRKWQKVWSKMLN